MEKEKKNKIAKILTDLKKAHDLLGRLKNNQQQCELLDIYQPTCDQLVKMGARPGTGEALIVYGLFWQDPKEAGTKEDKQASRAYLIKAQGVFGVKATTTTFGDRKALRMAIEKSAVVFKKVDEDRGLEKMNIEKLL